mmetsp:Transcript_9086/g.22797  ORF Transcript_9086/g.22797 Transcript_9086/m.22797 type:complete len:295 (+) Transcript_9086:2513-3397(+)
MPGLVAWSTTIADLVHLRGTRRDDCNAREHHLCGGRRCGLRRAYERVRAPQPDHCRWLCTITPVLFAHDLDSLAWHVMRNGPTSHVHTEELPALRLLGLGHHRGDHGINSPCCEVPGVHLPGRGHGLLEQVAHLMTVGRLRRIKVVILLIVEIPRHAPLLQVVQAQLLAPAGRGHPGHALERGGHDALASRAASQGVAAAGGDGVRLGPGGRPVRRHVTIPQSHVGADPDGGGHCGGPSQSGVLGEGQVLGRVHRVLHHLHRRDTVVPARLRITRPPLSQQLNPRLVLLARVAQ